MARVAQAWPVRVLAVWVLLSIVLLAISAHAIASRQFSDPDDALRLVQVRDLLGGQAWFDLHQYRIAAPDGILMHWSRLVDLPIAAVIFILRPILGTAQAELVALIAIPLLTLLATLLLIGRLAAKFFDGETVVIVCLVTACGMQLLYQMSPLRIDHHGWQIVLALVALNGLAARDGLRGGLVIGVSLAALVAISIEGLPITAVFLGVLALRGLTGPTPGQPAARPFLGLAAASGALGLGSSAIFLGTRGTGDLVTHCDQVSPIHLGLFGLVALGSAGLAWAPRRRPVALGVLGAMGVATLATYRLGAPECRGGAFAMLDPLVARLWYGHVTEGLPFWHLPLPLAVETIGLPLVGLIATVMVWRAATTEAERAWWRDYALVLAGALVVAALLQRASATAAGIAAIATGGLIMRWMIALRTQPPLHRIAGYLGLLIMVLPPLPLAVWSLLSAAFAPEAATAKTTPLAQCDYARAARALDTLRPTDLFMPLDIGAFILVRSHQRVVATDHHRGAAAMHDVISAFLGTADEAHAIIRRRHATVIAVCPSLGEPANYAYYAPKGFMAQLLGSRAPSWLQQVDLAPGSGMLFWKVTR